MEERKLLEHDYVRRWRVIAMLTYIKNHLHSDNINEILDKYIKFTKEIDENKWELERRKLWKEQMTKDYKH